MSEEKKLKFKCSVCGQEGHNKRTCPTTKADRILEIKKEVKQEPQIIYALEYAEDNGDDVHRNTTLYASLDGLVNGIEKLIRGVQEDLCVDEDELSDSEEKYPPSYAKELFYYSHHESMKNVPTPTKEFVEKVLAKKYDHLDGLILKVGHEIGGAAGFACEISVHKKTLNP